MRTRVKLCGMTAWNDVQLAIDAGADSFGMIFAPSPRQIAWRDAEYIAKNLGGEIEPVAVFVDPTADDVARVCALIPRVRVQLSGHETPTFVNTFGKAAMKAVHVAPGEETEAIASRSSAYTECDLLFDTAHAVLAGGTGETFAWSRIEPIARVRRAWIAGGLTPENVASCVRAVRPFGVDVRSGVETNGRKDAAKMRAFIRAVRESDET